MELGECETIWVFYGAYIVGVVVLCEKKVPACILQWKCSSHAKFTFSTGSDLFYRSLIDHERHSYPFMLLEPSLINLYAYYLSFVANILHKQMATGLCHSMLASNEW